MSHHNSDPISPQSDNNKKQNFFESTSISSQNELPNKKNSVDSNDLSGSVEYTYLDEFKSPSLSTDSLKNLMKKEVSPNPKTSDIFTLKTVDGKTFVGSFMKDNSFVLLNDELSKDPIFHKLCEKKNYRNTENCMACNASFNFFLKRKKICKFCGNNYCDQHFNKMRLDPRDKTKCYEICDTCEEKYLNRKINDMYIQKFQNRTSTVKKLEAECKKIETKMKEKNEIISQLKQAIQAKKNDQINEIKAVEERITEKKNETGKLERENVIANQAFVEVNQRIRNTENSVSEMAKEIKSLEEELANLNKDLTHLDEEISEKNEKLHEVETKIIHHKLRSKNIAAVSTIKKISKQNTLNGDILKNSYQTANSIQNISTTVTKAKGNRRKDIPPEYDNYYGYCSLF